MPARPPFKEKHFTPSYPVIDRVDYDRYIKECEPGAYIDSWSERTEVVPDYCKRLRHVMMRGGRKASRYETAEWAGGSDPGAYPPDPKEGPHTRGGGPFAARRGRPPEGQRPETRPGTMVGKPEGKKTKNRLDEPNPYFYARTQPFGYRHDRIAKLVKDTWVVIPRTPYRVKLFSYDPGRQSGELQIEQTGQVVADVSFRPRVPVEFNSSYFTIYVNGLSLVIRFAGSKDELLVQQTADAILRYMGQNQTVFIVPDDPRLLINAGMDTRIADLLVTRAANKRFQRFAEEKPPGTVLDALVASPLRTLRIGSYEKPKKQIYEQAAQISALGLPALENRQAFIESIEVVTKPLVDINLAPILQYLIDKQLIEVDSNVTAEQLDQELKTEKFDVENDNLVEALSELDSVDEVYASDDDLIFILPLTEQLGTRSISVVPLRTRIFDKEYPAFFDDIEKAFNAWVKAKTPRGERYNSDLNTEFLADLLQSSPQSHLYLLRDAQILGSPSQLLVTVREGINDERKQYLIPIFVGEHSNIKKFAARTTEIKYGNLDGVSLDALPQVLVRLRQRKTRKGRVLPVIKNPKAKTSVLAKRNTGLAETVGITVGPSEPAGSKLLRVFNALYPVDGSPAQLTEVEGKPHLVYWPEIIVKNEYDKTTGKLRKVKRPVSMREVTVEQAKSWLRVIEQTKIQRAKTPVDVSVEVTQEIATPVALPVVPTPPRRPTVRPTTQIMTATRSVPAPRSTSNPSASAEQRTKPMSDEDAFLFQYSKSPYGSEASIPASRRNPRPSRAVMSKIAHRAKELENRGHSKSVAWKTAWAEARGKKKAAPKAASRKAAPKALKVECPICGSKAQQPCRDERTLEVLRGGFHVGRTEKASRKAAPKASSRKAAPTASRKGARRNVSALQNPWYDSLYLPDETMVRPSLVRSATPWSDESMVRSSLVNGPYAMENPRRRRARKNEGDFDFSPENDMWPHHPVYEQTIGQFSTGEAFTHGIQPVNRRNPRRRRSARHNPYGYDLD